MSVPSWCGVGGKIQTEREGDTEDGRTYTEGVGLHHIE